ncbi:unnamed protein product [Lathyrus oleraceus]
MALLPGLNRSSGSAFRSVYQKNRSKEKQRCLISTVNNEDKDLKPLHSFLSLSIIITHFHFHQKDFSFTLKTSNTKLHLHCSSLFVYTLLKLPR